MSGITQALFAYSQGKPEFVSFEQDRNSTSSTSLSINKPSNVVEGNLLIAFAGNLQTGSTYSLPSGWVSLSQVSGRLLAYKVATASEPSSYTFTINVASTSFSGAIINIKNGVYAVNSGWGASGNPAIAPSITLTKANSLVFACSLSTGASGLDFTFPATWVTDVTEKTASVPSYAIAEKTYDAVNTGDISIIATTTSRAVIIGVGPK